MDKSCKIHRRGIEQTCENVDYILIDQEVKRIIDECYDRARHIIRKYDDVLHTCADLLLEKEKISREEFEALFPEDVSED